MRIIQGDQYGIRIKVTNRKTGAIITPEDCTGVRIAVDDVVHTYPGQLSYSQGGWIFPLTQEQSFRMKGFCEVQVQVRFGNDIAGDEIKKVDVKKTIIGGLWNE